MELSLPIPSEWSRSARRAVTPGISMQWSPLILLPDDQQAWIRAVVHSDVPSPTVRVRIIADHTSNTHTGWPLRIVEATLQDGEGGAIVEWRLAAFYAFFEHAASALVRATDETRYRAQLDQVRAILGRGSPDWSGEPATLSALWDVVATDDAPAARPRRAGHNHSHHHGPDRAVLEASLADVDVALADRTTAPLQLARARLLRELGRYQDAVEAYRAALALDATVAGAHHGLGLALAALDRHADAITEWEEAAAADPTDVDALYNAGLAHQRLGNAQPALASWRRALERAPRDFWILRKIIQAEYALERYDDAAKTRATLLEVWRTSDNPAVQLTDEFVFDQFDVDGVRVLANETLRPRDPMSYAIYSFRAEGPLEHGPLCVQIETSDYAKERGVPFVISLLDGTKYRALGTSEALPAYPDIRKTVRELVTNALAGRRT